MTTEYTDHFRLNLPDFRMGPWHDLVNDDFVTIDELLFSLYQGVDTQTWANNTHYTPGATAIDPADNSYWVCITSHTSALTGTFASDRAAHPTYWNRVVVGISPRGEWAHDTHYLPNDMVTSSTEHIIAVCKIDHTSNHAGTIRDDAAYWSFIADIGSVSVFAVNTSYDNSGGETANTNLQATTKELYTKDAAQQVAINANTAGVSNHAPRITALETSDSNQNTSITNNTNSITTLNSNLSALQTSTNAGFAANTTTDNAQDTSISTLNSQMTTKVNDAPADGTTYARKNNAWIDVLSVAGASVLVSDTPPAGARDSSLWWESDTGNLFIKYNDGDSSQWVVAVPQLDAGSFLASDVNANQAVRFDIAQTATAAQKTQARNNIGVQKKNYVANGGMQVSQENGAVAGTVNNYYPVDQFRTVISGTTGVVSVAQVASTTPGGSPNRIRATVTTADAAVASTDLVALITKIEGTRATDLLIGSASAKTIAMSFGVKAPAGTYCVTFENDAATRSFVAEVVIAAPEANTDVVKTITLPLDQTGAWLKDATGSGLTVIWGLMVGSSFAKAANAWGTDGSGIYGSTNQFNFMGTNGNVFELFDVGLYEGTVAPTFLLPDFRSELELCQVYWESSYNYGAAPGSTPGYYVEMYVTSGAGSYQTATQKFLKRKRVTPTMTFFSGGTGASGFAYAVVAAVNRTAAVDSVCDNSYTMYVSGAIASDLYRWHYTANARM